MEDIKEAQARNGYSEAVQAQALQERVSGRKYQEISQTLNVPEDTLKKWFAPSINRHNLATLKEEHFQELSKTSRRILEANVVSVTEKLAEMAMEGDMRAIIEILDRVHGTPAKQKPDESKKIDKIKIEFVDFSGSAKNSNSQETKT